MNNLATIAKPIESYEELAILAIAKVMKKKAVDQARDKARPGKYAVDFKASVTGTITIGEDYEKTPTVSIPYKKAFAALCYVAGCTGKHGIGKIQRAMEIALAESGDAAEEMSKLIPQVERIEEDVISPMLASLPKTTAKGPVTTKLEVNLLPA